MSVSVAVTKQTVTIDDGRDIVTVTPVTQAVSVASTGPQGATGATGAKGDKGDTGATGASGVVTVNAPLTNSGTSGSANISVSAASTSAAGVVQLSNSTSTTSSTLAATPTAVKAAYDLAGSAVVANNYQTSVGYTATSIETMPRSYVPFANVNYGTSGRAYFAMVRPVKDITVGTASVYCVSVGTAMTTARLGLYTYDDASGTAILVARTANDTSIFGTAATLQSRAFDTTGGYPATYTMVAGSAYAWAVVYVGTGLPFVGGFSTIANLTFATPRAFGLLTSQTDLPGTTSSLAATTGAVWGRFS